MFRLRWACFRHLPRRLANPTTHTPASQLPPPQAAGTAFREASWAATPVRTLRLRGVAVAALPALLPALQPPAAGSLERLVLDELRSEDDAPVAAAALQACVPHLESIGELELSRSFCAGEVQQALLPQLARLHTLRLTNCGLAALPAGTYLSGAGGLLRLVPGRQTIYWQPTQLLRTIWPGGGDAQHGGVACSAWGHPGTAAG